MDRTEIVTRYVAGRLRAALAEAALPQSALVGIAGMSASGVSRRYRGMAPITVVELDAIARRCGTTVVAMIGDLDKLSGDES